LIIGGICYHSRSIGPAIHYKTVLKDCTRIQATNWYFSANHFIRCQSTTGGHFRKTNLAALASQTAYQQIKLSQPKLWSLENTYLYKAVTKLYWKNQLIDEQTTSFGIRDARFEAANGFWLNGKNLKLKGVCLHHDGGAVGAAVPLGVWEERFKLLKEAGVNAIRTSHNPVAPEFLDLCDKMGFLVMDETFDTWTAPKHNGEKGYNLLFKDWWEKIPGIWCCAIEIILPFSFIVWAMKFMMT